MHKNFSEDLTTSVSALGIILDFYIQNTDAPDIEVLSAGEVS